MALSDIIAEAAGRDMQNKIRYHIVAAALAVMAEEEGHANHANRLAYARVVLTAGANIYQLTVAVAVNATITAKIEAGTDYDDDIAYVITTIFDAFANAEVMCEENT